MGWFSPTLFYIGRAYCENQGQNAGDSFTRHWLLYLLWPTWVAQHKIEAMEQQTLDTNAGKQLSQAATDFELTLVLRKWTTFKYGLDIWPTDVYK